MKKKILATTMAVVLGVTALTGCGSSGKDNYTIGISQFAVHGSLDNCREGFLAGLAEEGFVEGENLNIEYVNAQAEPGTAAMTTDNFVTKKVDMICAIATPTAMTAYNSTMNTEIPVIYTAVSDPVGAGLVASMEAPGSNITGTSDALNTEAVLELILAADPDIKKVGLLYNKSEDASKAPVEAVKSYCEAKGIEVVEKTGTNNDEISLAADALISSGAEAVFTPTDNTVMTAELAIYEKFIEAGVPHYGGADSFALNGAFLGYGVNYEELGTATADMIVDVLVNGADPASVEVVTLDNGIATVNTETAQAIGYDYSMFTDKCTQLKEIVTAKEFD